MRRPLCIDLFCGLGGWTQGFLAEGYDVVGFDNHQHVKGGACTPRSIGKRDSRKAASAMIAKIPLNLARFIARSYKPRSEAIA